MANYSYVLMDAKGKKKKGSIETENRDRAIEQLKQLQGMTIISVKDASALNTDIELRFLQPKPKPRDMAVFCRQFVSIVNAGVPVIQALSMLSEQTENKKLAEAITGCRKSIERGETLATAMMEWPAIFPSMFVTMVEAGEASGSLEVSFARMAEQFEKTAKLKATVKKATTYPVSIMCIAVIAVVVLLTKVVPTFTDMLDQLGTALPGLTVFVVDASDFMKDSWYLLLIAVASLVVVLQVFKSSDVGQHVFGMIALKLPLINKLTIKTASARMARTLSTLLGSGLPLMDSLDITARTMTNVYFKEELLRAREAVGMGSSLSEPLAEGGLFPPLVHHMLNIGEETGSIEGMLDKLSDYYEDEVQQATEQVMSALEPMLIVLLAVIIGTIVLSVVLPMANMYSGLDNL